jgi:hypothetical protein
MEAPERKVLKEMLLKLKTKTITSQTMFAGLSLSMSTSMTEWLKNAFEGVLKMPEGEAKKSALLMLVVFQTWNQNLSLLNVSIGNLIGDMNLYIETLEKYSTEIDNTFTSIVEKARKMAEEQQKQQEEQRKKRIDYGV